MTDARSAQRIPVVATFLVRRGRILLLRRSAQVGTYRGRWAGVSGYVERVPLAQALVELQEETGLAREDLSLRGVGVPVPVDDTAEGRYWLVYPFAFALGTECEPRPDWESVESRWVKPEEVASLDTVPGLAEVVARVWPPFGNATLWRAATAIADDRTSGATELARRALRALDRFSSAPRVSPDQKLRAARALAALRPSMAILPHIMARALDRRAPAGSLEVELREASRRSAERAAKALRRCRRVLTHSASAICEQTLLAWAQARPEARITVTESRPQGEGVALASRLSARGVRVTLITDAQLALAVAEADAVLVGADAITEDDQVINKAGTALAALAAREAGVPVYAATQTHKIAPPGWPVALEHQEPEDVHPEVGFRVQNVAFDATPLDRFTAVLTERGRLTPRLLARTRAALSRSPLVP